MKIFISYSVGDSGLVRRIAAEIAAHAEALFWDQNRELGKDAWRTIFGWIDNADCVLTIITDRVVARGESVNQEIGYARGRGKIVIPMVSATVDKQRLGCLNGVTYVEFDSGNLSAAIDAIKQKLGAMDKAKQEQQGWAMLAVIALVLLALGAKE